MFSNGTEYDEFMSINCNRCTKYVDFLEAEEGKTVCSIEDKIAHCSITGEESDFPYDDLKPVGRMCRYVCKSFNSHDKHLMERYRQILDDEN